MLSVTQSVKDELEVLEKEDKSSVLVCHCWLSSLVSFQLLILLFWNLGLAFVLP